MQTLADQIWNRACGFGVTTSVLGAGDLALEAMLSFHGVAMNGGVLHATACLDIAKLECASSGYRYFGLNEVADLLRGTSDRVSNSQDLNSLEVQLNEEYGRFIPDDSFLFKCFENFLIDKPAAFAPI